MPTTTSTTSTATSADRSDKERFNDILAVQRAAYLRDGAPSLTQRRHDLKKFRAACSRGAAPSRKRSTPTSAIARDTRPR